MNIFYVCQNKNYKDESKYEYLWSPHKAKNGANNKGYTNMALVKKGDIIFHGARQETYAISIAKKDCYNAPRPKNINNLLDEQTTDEIGYRIDSKYTILTKSVQMKLLYDWLKKNHKGENSAFKINGGCKELYLNLLDIDHAKYILNEAVKLKQDSDVENMLHQIFNRISDIKYYEYDDNEMYEIGNIVDDINNEESPVWKGIAGTQEFNNSNGTGTPKPKRNAKVAANALIIAKHKCEYDGDEYRTFYKKSGVKYTEPHHLIPISKYRDFEYENGKYRNLDVEENIVSLCSYCHNLLHYGRPEDKKIILEKLFHERKEALKKVDIKLDKFEDLMRYYI